MMFTKFSGIAFPRPTHNRNLVPVFILSIAGTAMAAGSLVPTGDSKIEADVWANRDMKLRVDQMAPLATQEGWTRLTNAGIASRNLNTAQVAIYFDEQPSIAEQQRLEGLGVQLALDTWVPPVPGKHTHGFMLASVPYTQLVAAAEGITVQRIASVERALRPQNNLAGARIQADLVHDLVPTGYDGSGVSIAIIDSSLDVFHPDIPWPTEAYDVTDGVGIANWDTDVASTKSRHGTLVTGCALGRGFLSGGTYKGIAPGASLYFYKAGDDIDASASDEDIIEALSRAVSLGVDVVNISYAGWSPYHDGSSALCQAIDAAVASGTVVFTAAGNLRRDGRHVSTTFSGAAVQSSNLEFWASSDFGGPAYTDPIYVDVVYRDESPGDGNISLNITNLGSNETLVEHSSGTSSRGTESVTYLLLPHVFSDDTNVWSVQLTNTADYPVDVHIYLRPTSPLGAFFNFPDDNYTISTPADADSAIAVGSWVTRTTYTDSVGGSHSTSETLNSLSRSSNFGPRIDGLMKPEICAPGDRIISCLDLGMTRPWVGLQIDNDGVIGQGRVDYMVSSGTSLASPIAAGAAALLLEAYPSLSPDQVRAILMATANQALSPDNSAGAGVINIYAAITGDCNANGSPDAAEVADGSIIDCNANFVPDACEDLPPGGDCNCNGFLDDADFVIFTNCAMGPVGSSMPTNCGCVDLDYDDNVDLVDFAMIQAIAAQWPE